MAKNTSKQKTATSKKPTKVAKKRLMQCDVPAHDLDQALRVARAIHAKCENGSGAPVAVAAAMEMTPTSGTFRALCGASIAYGLTEGGYNATAITLTPIGTRLVAPTEEGDDQLARREAAMKPRVLSEFLKRYDGKKIPREEIARNVLEEMGVPKASTGKTFGLIKRTAQSIGVLRTIKDRLFVDVSAGSTPSDDEDDHRPQEDRDSDLGQSSNPHRSEPKETGRPESLTQGREGDAALLRRVFITHGKNRKFVDTIQKLLQFGELEPVVSVHRQSVSQPVPEKVLRDMRGCGAAIIHLDAEDSLSDTKGQEHSVLNPNVLIEIGAAMALYGQRFVLLVREGIQLPSNLQGLFEVRYRGDDLGSEVTIKLLESINDIKKHDIPHRHLAAPAEE